MVGLKVYTTKIRTLHALGVFHVRLCHILYHLKELLILRRMTPRLLSRDDLIINAEHIMNSRDYLLFIFIRIVEILIPCSAA